jgi:hypothetical protein
MEHYRNAPSRRTPPPDVVRMPLATPPFQPPAPPIPNPNFLIIGLFALRLAKRLIEGLEIYPGRDADAAWLTNFLSPYPLGFALAKISGPRKEDYLAVYQSIISRMTKQPRYPLRFMQMNPDRSMQQQQGKREVKGAGEIDMTDRECCTSAVLELYHAEAKDVSVERLDIIDFCDAAGEWGSTVPIPAREAARMIELAEQRQIADLDCRRLI